MHVNNFAFGFLLLICCAAPLSGADHLELRRAFENRINSAIEEADIPSGERVYPNKQGDQVERWQNVDDAEEWRTEMKEAVAAILSVKLGRKLFTLLEELLRKAEGDGAPCVLILSARGGPSFQPKPLLPNDASVWKPLRLCVRMPGLFAPPIYACAISPRIYEAETAEGRRWKARLIGPSARPTDLDCVLFHELVHMVHFLEELVLTRKPALPPPAAITSEESLASVCEAIMELGYGRSQQMDKDAIAETFSAYLPEIYAIFPELREDRNGEFWPNLEERRTLSGPGELNENAYRAARNMQARYSHRKGLRLVEYAATVDRLLAPWDFPSLAYALRLQDIDAVDIDFIPPSIKAVYRRGRCCWPPPSTPVAPSPAPSRV